MTNDDALLAELKQAAAPPPPPNFRPGVVFSGRQPSEITTGPLPLLGDNEYDDAVREAGYPLPDNMTLVLSEMVMVQRDNEAAWHRDAEDRGKNHTAYTAPSSSKMWRYKFKVVLKSARHDEDIAALMAEAKAIAPDLPVRESAGVTSKIVNLSDFQWGKTDENGGTAETLKASEVALARVVAMLVENPVDEILLVDEGDILEGTESSPNALGTNDLSTTEQVRISRRVFWRWIEALAPLAPIMKVVGVPSNHCRVRRGKAPLGDAHDDWGIEVISQLADIAAVNPEAFGHVEFIIPNAHEEHVLLELVGGQWIGFHHGHHVGAAQLTTWVKKTGRRGLAQADIVVVGHHHHLVVEAFGDMQWLMICPTMDPGSSWHTVAAGERSERGVLTFSVDRRGWFDLEPIWVGDAA